MARIIIPTAVAVLRNELVEATAAHMVNQELGLDRSHPDRRRTKRAYLRARRAFDKASILN